jgi:hypothetical protein
MSEIVIPKPSAKQKLFLTDAHKYVGYGGSRGGGKSWAVQTKAKILCMAYPGIRCAIIRRTYPELESNHIRVLTAELQSTHTCRYNKMDKRLTFTNGSVIEFRFAQHTDELSKFQGQQWDVIFIDEATQWSEEELKIISACCRGVNNFPKRIYYTCNPGGPGHTYIKRIFIDRKYEDGENPDDYSFIQSKVTDNTALMHKDPEYIRYLEALPPKLKKAWLDGDWDTMSGPFFEEFRDSPEHYDDRQWTHVINPFTPPANWTCYRGYDFGYSKPFSVGWYFMDDDGRMYRALEWYGWDGVPNEGQKLTADEQFNHIKEIEEQHPWLRGRRIIGIADPAIWQADSGKSVADTAAAKGIYFSPGDHQRIAGWMQCHYRLQFDANGIPMFYVFKTCPQFIRTIGLQMYDEHRVEDLDSDLEDHAMDEWRYVCMARPIKAQAPKEKVVYTDGDPLNQRIPKAKHRFISHRI